MRLAARLAAPTLAGLLALSACAPRPGSAAGETAVSRDTAGPTLVILPGSAVPSTAMTSAPTPPSTEALTAVGEAPATRHAPGEADLTLEPCQDQACATEAGHLWLARPIPDEAGYINFVERSYPYGSTQGGQREPHLGVEFFNPTGTPVLAAGPGEVVVAGEDRVEAIGPRTNYYGRLVVIRHDQTYNEQPVYSLYAHLSSVDTRVGARVAAGDLIGRVGQTGIAIGPHLHFEVRVGANDAASTRNPELWLTPLPASGRPNGAIAGRVLDRDGNPVPEVTVVIRPITTENPGTRNRFVVTYADAPELNPDDQLQENFAIGDVPRGLYSVSVSATRFHQQNVTVNAGEVAFVTFVVEPLPPTPTPNGSETATPTETPTETGTPEAEVTPQETPPLAETPVEAPTAEATPTLEAPPSETPTPG